MVIPTCSVSFSIIVCRYFSEKVYFRSQILERPSIGEFWNIFSVPVLTENVIFTFFRTCWSYSETYNTGTQNWSSIVQCSRTSIWDFKYTFSYFSKWRINVSLKLKRSQQPPSLSDGLPYPRVRWYPQFFFTIMTAKDVKEITFMPLVTFFSVLERPGKKNVRGLQQPPLG